MRNRFWCCSIGFGALVGFVSASGAAEMSARGAFQVDDVVVVSDEMVLPASCAEDCAEEADCGCPDECGDTVGDDCCDAVGCGDTCRSDCGLFGGCELGDPWDLADEVCGPCRAFDIGGWTQFGYHNNNDGVFNTRPHEFQLHQGWLYAEKIADGSDGLGFGGRADAVYGTDGSNTQAFGNPPGSWDFANGWDHGAYGWAMPQLYVEAAYGDTSVKVGHFFTPMGYQVVPAIGNFFYSIPYTFNFSEAFTHTGALATHKASDDVTLYAGYTLGWDTGFDQLNQGNNFLGGATLALTDDTTVTYILSAGNLGWIGDNAYTHSIVGTVNLSDKWQYVMQNDVVHVENSINSGGTTYATVGINQYLFYTINDCWKAGARVEWWKADGISLYEMAYGLNYKPTANLTIRPEIRYNWCPSDTLPSVLPVVSQVGNSTSVSDYQENTIFGIDAILQF